MIIIQFMVILTNLIAACIHSLKKNNMIWSILIKKKKQQDWLHCLEEDSYLVSPQSSINLPEGTNYCKPHCAAWIINLGRA